MKQSFRNFTRIHRAPADDSMSGGSGAAPESIDSMSDAMAELDRRDAARKAAAKADKAAKAKPADDEDDTDDEGSDPDIDKRRVKEPKAEKPEKKAKAKDDADADEEADDEDDDTESDEDGDDDASDDDAETSDEDDEDDDSEAKDKGKKRSLDDDTVEIEFEGEKHRVPAKLKDAFKRQSHFTQEMQSLAQERQATHQSYQQVQGVAQQLSQTQGTLLQYAKAMLGDEPDLSLAQSDPSSYMVQKGLHEQRTRAVQHLMEQGQRVQQQQQVVQQEQVRMAAVQGASHLLRAMPELADPKKRELFTRDIVSVATKFGFQPQDLASVNDHRLMLLLHDHARLQRGEARVKQASESVKQKLANVPPKAMRPGNASPDEGKGQRNAEAKARFMKSGRSMKDVRAALGRMR